MTRSLHVSLQDKTFKVVSIIWLLGATASLADSASANEQSFNEYYPTPQEIAEDCNQSIRFAEKGDYGSFSRSACVSRIQGIITGFYIAIHMIDYPETQEVASAKSVLEKVSKRICLPALGPDEPQLVELKIARDYVKYVSDYKGSLPIEKFVNKRSAAHIADMLQANCRKER